MITIYDVITKRLVSEKTDAAEKVGKYTFQVHKSASKLLVKKAVEKIFDVKVNKVNILNSKGTTRIFRGIKGKTASCKKAIVSLVTGQRIKDLGGV